MEEDEEGGNTMKKEYIFSKSISKLSDKKLIRFKWCT